MGKEHKHMDCIKSRGAQAENQVDIFFPVDGYHAILNKANKKMETNRPQMNYDN